MTNLTDWLTQARDRTDAATEGPWATTFGPRENPRVWGPDDDASEPIAVLHARGWIDPAGAVSTAAFIAAARTDLPAALDAIQAVLDLTDPDFEPAQSDYECSLTRFDVREAIATALGVSEP